MLTCISHASHTIWFQICSQALEKSLDIDLDVCKVLRDVSPKDDILNQVRVCHPCIT